MLARAGSSSAQMEGESRAPRPRDIALWTGVTQLDGKARFTSIQTPNQPTENPHPQLDYGDNPPTLRTAHTERRVARVWPPGLGFPQKWQLGFGRPAVPSHCVATADSIQPRAYRLAREEKQ